MVLACPQTISPCVAVLWIRFPWSHHPAAAIEVCAFLLSIYLGDIDSHGNAWNGGRNLSLFESFVKTSLAFLHSAIARCLGKFKVMPMPRMHPLNVCTSCPLVLQNCCILWVLGKDQSDMKHAYAFTATAVPLRATGQHGAAQKRLPLLPAPPPRQPNQGKNMEKLDEGWPESVEEHGERCKYDDLLAWNINIEIYDDSMMPKIQMKRHGADMLRWKVGTYEEIAGEIKEIWNEGDTRRRIERDVFTYKHVHTYKHALHTTVFFPTLTCGVFVFSAVSAPPSSSSSSVLRPPSSRPSSRLSHTHSLTLLRGRRGTWCSARGRMYALASLGLRWLLRGRCGTWCSAGGRMCALASLGLRRSAGGFCVAGAALGALQGVGCTPWRPLVSGGFCVAGAALGALQGVGCTPWRPLVSATLPVAFRCHTRRLVLCKGSDVRPGVPWSPPLCRWLFGATRGAWCSARGRMYALASLGLRHSAGGFSVPHAALGALQGVGCTPWRPLVSAALRGRCGTWCSAGVGCTPGVPWSPSLGRWLLRGRCVS